MDASDSLALIRLALIRLASLSGRLQSQTRTPTGS